MLVILLIINSSFIITSADSYDASTHLNYLDLHPNDELIAVAAQKVGKPVIEIWNATNRNRIRSIENQNNTILKVEWNKDGSKLASSSSEGSLVIYDTSSFKELSRLSFEWNSIRSFSWSPIENKIAIGVDSDVIIWDIESNSTIKIVEEDQWRNKHIGWNFDGTQIAVAQWGTFMIVDPLTGDKINTLLDANDILSIDWHPQKNQILVGATHGNLSIWDINTRTVIKTIYESQSFINMAKWSPNAKYVAFITESDYSVTTGDYSWVKIWNLLTDEIETVYSANYIYNLDWKSNSQEIVIAEHSKIIYRQISESPESNPQTSSELSVNLLFQVGVMMVLIPLIKFLKKNKKML